MCKVLIRVLVTFAFNLSLVLAAGCEDTLTSPDGKVKVRVFVNDNNILTYNITRNRTKILQDSPIGITVDGIDLGSFVVLGEPEVHTVNETYPWRGVHSVAVNHYNGATIQITHIPTDTIYSLEIRAFNDGFAFRYIVPGTAVRTVNNEATAWRLPKGSKVWFQKSSSNYEELYRKKPPDKISKRAPVVFPVTAELVDGSYVSLTEAAVFNYSGMTVQPTGTSTLKGIFEDDKEGFKVKGVITTPWRVVMTGPGLNDLVNSDIVSNLCPEPDRKLFPKGINTEWIKPGRALWHWWSTENPTYEEHKPWVDAASKMGLEYYLVDESWGSWKDPKRDKWDMLKEFVKYAKERNVSIWAWKSCPDRNDIPGILNEKARLEFFKRCWEVGIVGVKIDFMDSESKDMMDFYESALKQAAGYKLMVNFHGANKPAGESRTYPNEMTREGVRGLEWNKWSVLPRQYYATLPFTRYLAGHGDFTPCTFNPQFLKGTTFTQQLATAIVYTSPLMHWADKPEMYLRNKTIDIIRKIPSTWDQTIVLEGSKIGELAAFARRNGNNCFVGIINGDKERQYNLDLSFLGQGAYNATIVRDVMDNPADMTLEKSVVDSRDMIFIDMRSGGGFVAHFEPR